MNNLDILKIADGIKQLENNIDNNINLELSDEIPHESFADPRLDKSDNGKSPCQGAGYNSGSDNNRPLLQQLNIQRQVGGKTPRIRTAEHSGRHVQAHA